MGNGKRSPVRCNVSAKQNPASILSHAKEKSTYENSRHNLVLHELNLEQIAHYRAAVQLRVVRRPLSIR